MKFLGWLKESWLWLVKPWSVGSKENNTPPLTNASRFNPIANASFAVFVLTGILAIGNGLKHFHVYYDYFKIPFDKIEISIYEIIYKPSMLFLRDSGFFEWFAIYACVLITLIASKPPWGERRINLLFIALVPVPWLLFGGHLTDIQTHIAKERFVWDILLRDTIYPRVVASQTPPYPFPPFPTTPLTNQPTPQAEENSTLVKNTSDYLKNGCFYLIYQDKTTSYLMMDPAINPKWHFEDFFSTTELQALKNQSFEECLNQFKLTSPQNAEKINTCTDEGFQKAYNDKRKIFFAEKYKTKEQIINSADKMREIIITTQIQTSSLKWMHTLPLGARSLNTCPPPFDTDTSLNHNTP
ncbi:MAG: hypothetical protein H7839_01940 [Magnetococcus sp. YQC-5]